MREIVHKAYLNNFKASDELLELNAGTGIDALFLASRVIKVFTTDISDNMIEIIKEKVKNQKVENFIEAKQCSFGEIESVRKNNFDGVISNFGGLNCINDFKKLSEDLSLKIKQGGKFIAVVMNRNCPWEIFYYAMRLDFKNVFRRAKREGIDAALGNELIKTYYFTPAQFGGFFEKYFKVKRIYTLGLFTPPPFLIGIYRKLKPIVKIFMKIDELLKGVFPFNRLGDHFIIIMEKI